VSRERPVAVDRTHVDPATVASVPPEHLSCTICGAPALVVVHREPPLRAPVPHVVCSSLICPTNLEGYDDVEPLDVVPRAV
jgi:hypothetical protein